MPSTSRVIVWLGFRLKSAKTFPSTRGKDCRQRKESWKSERKARDTLQKAGHLCEVSDLATFWTTGKEERNPGTIGEVVQEAGGSRHPAKKAWKSHWV